MSEPREYHVSNEVEIIEVFDNPGDAEAFADKERKTCPCGEDAGPEGLYCGVLSPHGVSVSASENGYDVTQDYLINGR